MAIGSASAITSAYSTNNSVRLVRGGSEYFQLLEQMINDARHILHLQTYIFLPDETGMRIVAALIRAAQRGVQVFMMLDAYGSDQLTATWPVELQTKGVQVKWFGPVLWSRHFYFSRRMHHKVCVADGWKSLAGGVNICDRYNDLPGDPAWHDWAIYCCGEASLAMEQVCISVWNMTGPKKERMPAGVVSKPAPCAEGNCEVRIRQNDWVRRKLQIARSYLEMFRDAHEEIIIMSSYFLPGTAIRRAMKKALKRGVRIRVIAAGKSDVWTSKQAERYLYRRLIRQGVEIYEFDSNVLHGKLSTYDRKWVTIGSYNVNDISAFACLELNVDVLNHAFAADVQQAMHQVMYSQCRMITHEEIQQYSWLDRVLQQACFYFVRSVFVLFTFYFKQEKRENGNG